MSRDQAYDQIEKIWDLSKRAKSVLPTTPYGAYDGESDEDSIPSVDSAIHLSSPPLLLTTEEDDPDKHLQEPVNALPNKSSISTTASTSHSTLAKGVYVSDTLSEFNNRTNNRPRAVSDSCKERRTFNETKSDSDSKREILRHDSGAVTPIKKTRVCPCTVKGEQYLHIALNETYNGSVEAMFKLLFDSDFIKKFLERYENFEDVQVGGWKHGAREVIGKRRIKSSTMGKYKLRTFIP